MHHVKVRCLLLFARVKFNFLIAEYIHNDWLKIKVVVEYFQFVNPRIGHLDFKSAVGVKESLLFVAALTIQFELDVRKL